MDKDVRYIYIYIERERERERERGILLSNKKEQNFAIYNNMDGLAGYYSK